MSPRSAVIHCAALQTGQDACYARARSRAADLLRPASSPDPMSARRLRGACRPCGYPRTLGDRRTTRFRCRAACARSCHPVPHAVYPLQACRLRGRDEVHVTAARLAQVKLGHLAPHAVDLLFVLAFMLGKAIGFRPTSSLRMSTSACDIRANAPSASRTS